MKRLEIISVRASGNCEEWSNTCLMELRLYLKQLRRAQDVSSVEVEFYVNAHLPGDLAVILSWTSKQPKNMKNDLGLCLADAMRHFGLVDHTCWFSIEDC